MVHNVQSIVALIVYRRNFSYPKIKNNEYYFF